ncbi:MAG: 16S rRNA (cytidine(1402)-2'-O)-methyltransferase [Nitrospiraceae bacterium]
MPGTLYLVSMPIGHPDDLTLRALRILRTVPIIAAEDPARTKPLLAAHAIETPLTSYHDRNKEDKAPVLIRRLQEGESVALVAEAGTPAVVDPGLVLIRQALASGIRVVPVPGPSAALAAVPASGLSGDRFVFEGFLPRRSEARRRSLAVLRHDARTVILFETPARLRSTLATIRSLLGNRRLVLAHDLTKPDEELLRGTVEEVLKTLASRSLRGDITLVVEGAGRRPAKRSSKTSKEASRRRVSGSSHGRSGRGVPD